MIELKAADHNWMERAREVAALCWCDQETSGIEMDARLAEAFARRLSAWMRDAARYAGDAKFWSERCAALETRLQDVATLEGKLAANAAAPVDIEALAEKLEKVAADSWPFTGPLSGPHRQFVDVLRESLDSAATLVANPVDHPKPLLFHSTEGWKTMGKDESPPAPGLSRREQVWLSAWCAKVQSGVCASKDAPAAWADDCFARFVARFPDPTGGDR